MKRVVGLVACVVLLVAAALVDVPAAASTQGEVPIELESRAPYIVAGTVVSTTSVLVDGEPHRVARIESVETLQGSLEAEALFVETPGGDLPDGNVMYFAHVATFAEGDEVQVALEDAAEPLGLAISQQLDPEIATYSVVGGDDGVVLTSPQSFSSANAVGDYALTGTRWASFNPPVAFKVNPANSGMTSAATISGVRRGFQLWEDDALSSIDFTYAGTSTKTGTNLGDGEVVVSWVNTSASWLAQANWISNHDGTIISFDIQVNRGYLWSDGAQGGRFDIGTVIAHEVGHGIGFGHAPASSEIMHSVIPSGSVKPLGPGDRSGARALYPSEPVGYVPISPTRILDTRNTTHGAYSTPWSQDETRAVQITGIGNVPSQGVDVVAMQVTSVNPTAAASFLTIWETGGRPTAASKNFGTIGSGSAGHAAVTNDLTIVPVADDGTVQVYNWRGQVDIVIDVVGYYTEGGGALYTELTPARILDTRDNVHGDYSTPWGQDQTRSVQIAGRGGVPSGVDAVVMHVTSVYPTASASFLTIWATGGRPLAASKNYGKDAGGQSGHAAVTNDLIIVPVAANGSVNFYNWRGAVDIVVDVVGYYGSGGGLGYLELNPARILDTRDTTHGAYSTPWGQDQTRSVQVTDIGGVPASGVSAVVVQVASVTPSAPTSYLTVWGGGGRPLAASKNYGTLGGGGLGHAATTNETLIIPVAADGTVQFYNYRGDVDVVVDVIGYYAD